MESTVFRNETEKLYVKEITPEEAKEISRLLWRSDRVKQLVKELGDEPLDEYVKAFVGISGQTDVKVDQFVEFLDNIVALRKEIKEDQPLIEEYQELDPVHRALPLLAVAEIAKLIVLAIATGAAKSLGNSLIWKFLSRRKKKRPEVLVRMLLSSPIPSVLSKYDWGLSIKEIAEETRIAEKDVEALLAKYKERGWVSKEVVGEKEVWRIRERDVIRDFEP